MDSVPVFRELNLRILATWRSLGAEGDLELFCECEHQHCTEHFRVAPADYESAVAPRGARLVIAGHQRPEDQVVLDTGSYIAAVAPGHD